MKVHTALRRLFGVRGPPRCMVVIRYGIAGHPVQQSLSPLLMALVTDHLRLPSDSKSLELEIVDATSIHDALAWGYAGAVPSPLVWDCTNGEFGKFRTSTLLGKAVEKARDITEASPLLGEAKDTTLPPQTPAGLPTRMFDSEIWLNLTSPLKHQLDSSAVQCIDDAMDIKAVNALRWDGKGWWCAGLDGQGIVDVLAHHDVLPSRHVLGLVGGGGAARSTASAWIRHNGRLHPLSSRRDLEHEALDSAITDALPDAVVDFDGTYTESDGSVLVVKAAYTSVKGDANARLHQLASTPLDGRWLLVAQHLACWRTLWAPERAEALPSLPLLLTKLVEAEAMLASYA